VDLLLFSFDPSGMFDGAALGGEVEPSAESLGPCVEEKGCRSLTELWLELVANEPLVISWSDFVRKDTGIPSTEVYLMAKKVEEGGRFEVKLAFNVEKKPPLPPGIVFVIVFFSLAFSISGIIFSLYKLHRKNIIEVRIPKLFRFWCFEGYLSPEEKAAIAAEAERLRELEKQKELMYRMSAKPTVGGFKIEDSMFKYEEDYDEPLAGEEGEVENTLDGLADSES